MATKKVWKCHQCGIKMSTHRNIIGVPTHICRAFKGRRVYPLVLSDE